MTSESLPCESADNTPRRSNKSSVVWTLLAINIALLVVLCFKYGPTAHAQAARPSDYIMVPGQLQGVPTGVVFILDTSKGELSAMTYNENNNQIEPMPKISLEAVFAAGGAVGPGGGKIKPR